MVKWIYCVKQLRLNSWNNRIKLQMYNRRELQFENFAENCWPRDPVPPNGWSGKAGWDPNYWRPNLDSAPIKQVGTWLANAVIRPTGLSRRALATNLPNICENRLHLRFSVPTCMTNELWFLQFSSTKDSIAVMHFNREIMECINEGQHAASKYALQRGHVVSAIMLHWGTKFESQSGNVLTIPGSLY